MVKKNGVRNWLIFAISAGIVLFGIASAFYGINGGVKHGKEERKDMCVDIDANALRVGLVEDEVIGLKKDVKHLNEKMGEGFERIETTQKEILTEIKELHK